jgi:hypothetical protein
MRTMIKISIPAAAGNRAFKEGIMPRMIQEFIEQWKPEAAYFSPTDGQRTAIFIVDLKDESQIVQIADPFFTSLEAEVTLTPVMTAQDLKAGLEKVRD